MRVEETEEVEYVRKYIDFINAGGFMLVQYFEGVNFRLRETTAAFFSCI